MANYREPNPRAGLSELSRRTEAPAISWLSRKARAMTETLTQEFPEEVGWQRPEGGLCLWVELPAGMRTGLRSRFFQKSFERDVLYVPGEFCYADDPTRRAGRSGMRLSFGSASEDDLREGIVRLGKVYREEKARKKG